MNEEKQVMEKTDIQNWWAGNPMTYGEDHGKVSYEGKSFEFGSQAFFDRLDKEFYSWNTPLHGEKPFDKLFPYQNYRKGSKVLEIGCGMGTMAMNWARNGVEMTAVDLNPVAILQTSRRFEMLGLQGEIRQADGNVLPFADNTFDYTYSWGVLHHSPDLEKSIAEMMRVTRPGGGFGIMLYNRRSFNHWYITEFQEGYLHMESEFLGPLELASRYGDGLREEGNPHTWPMTVKEMEAMFRPHVRDLDHRILGTELDGMFASLSPGIGMFLPRFVKKVWARRFGWSIWMHGHKAA